MSDLKKEHLNNYKNTMILRNSESETQWTFE